MWNTGSNNNNNTVIYKCTWYSYNERRLHISKNFINSHYALIMEKYAIVKSLILVQIHVLTATLTWKCVPYTVRKYSEVRPIRAVVDRKLKYAV